MGASEVVVATLSASVVRQALDIWLGWRGRAEMTTAELVDAKVAGPLESRRVLRQISDLEDAVFVRLTEDTEAAPVTETERERVVSAVVADFENAQLNEDDLRAAQFDPVAVAGLVRARAAGVPEGMSPAAATMYHTMIDRTAAIFVAVVSTVPLSEWRSLLNILRRDGQVLETLHDVLTRLPTRSGDGMDDAERLYRSYLTETLDRVELVGFPSVGRAGHGRLTETFIQPDVRIRDASVPLDWALADNPRLFLHAPAGSGKTSILKWLAVASARGSADGLLGPVADLLPLYIVVRRLSAGGGPPGISSGLADLAISPSSAHRIEERLRERARSGGLLFLIDGLDETSVDRRARTLDWLGALVTRYPECRFVVTSRNLVPEELLPVRFASAQVMSLDRNGVMRLTRQWIGALATDEPPGAATAQAQRLISVIEGDSRLGELASSPLMCSLISVLYRERGPIALRGPDIHEAFVEMFVSRRDKERAIEGSGRWTYRTMLKLLKALAARMMFSGVDELSRDEAQAVLDQMHSRITVNDDPAAAYDHLIARSGLLTEPVPGRMSFVHRTFREHLCAREILEQDLIAMAVDQAHDLAWREVLITIAALADHREADRLVELLLRRYVEEPIRRPVLGPLTQSCLATVHWLGPHIRQKADNVWREIPPISEASERLLVEADNPDDGRALAIWLQAEPPSRFAEPIAVVFVGGQEDSSRYRIWILSRAILRIADVVQAIVDWARAQPTPRAGTFLVQRDGGAEIIVRPGPHRDNA